jgi:hypothetical protein
MKEYDERTPATEKGAVTQTTEASQWLERTDLLLGQLRDLRLGRQLLETYKNIMYPPGPRQ